jgi:hypothetical protein
MSATDSIPSPKPSKPYPEFTLFPHATGRWAKKMRGKLHYFGRWSDPDSALTKYLGQKEDLHAGLLPRVGVKYLGFEANLSLTGDSQSLSVR